MTQNLDVKTLAQYDLYRQQAEVREETTYFFKAAKSKDHQRYHGLEEDHRLPYKRDVDRIVHSKAYARYVDKTQVVYLVQNDHITHRGLHVQFVSNFARGIAEILRLNTDLVEAIALGPDVGHPPFGHEGEVYLRELSEEYQGAAFAHPRQSCRLFSEIEPLNLTLATLDGILCHDGGMKDIVITPRWNKGFQDHFQDLGTKRQDPESNITPATLEGCLVKLCDTMSYLGKDIEDAISLGIIKKEQCPKTYLGNSNRVMLATLAQDMIANSYEKEHIAISKDAFDALKEIRKFNFENIYFHPKLKAESKKIKRSYRILFELLLEDLKNKGKSSYLYENFLSGKSQHYLAEGSDVQFVIDFIAGMTDNYFVRTLEKLFVPSRIAF